MSVCDPSRTCYNLVYSIELCIYIYYILYTIYNICYSYRVGNPSALLMLEHNNYHFQKNYFSVTGILFFICIRVIRPAPEL